MSNDATVIVDEPLEAFAAGVNWRMWGAAALMTVVVAAGSIYANLAWTVTNPADFRYFPPFEAGFNANHNRALGHEYFAIARALAAGKGFADPFPAAKGPTAWMPPVLPALLAALLWVCEGDAAAVVIIVLVLKGCVLIGTGLLVVQVARQTAPRVGIALPTLVFLVLLLARFRQAFQFANDAWIILLAVDLLLAGFLWFDYIRSWRTAALWGLCGGVCALVSPIAAFAWGGVTLIDCCRARAWSRLAVALTAFALTLTPWMIRNYLVFGRWLPVKSNLAYELYQSQCLQPDGLLQSPTFGLHPNVSGSRESFDFQALGEIGYLDLKRRQFWDAVAANPMDFFDRVAERFLAATVWYVPFQRTHEARHPWLLWFHRLTHPWPLVGLAVLVLTGVVRPLQRAHGCAIGVYCLYLLPYIVISYYDRYAFPVLAAQALLTIWGIERVVSLLRSR